METPTWLNGLIQYDEEKNIFIQYLIKFIFNFVWMLCAKLLNFRIIFSMHSILVFKYFLCIYLSFELFNGILVLIGVLLLTKRFLSPWKQLQREVLECSGYVIGALLSMRQSEWQGLFCISLVLTVLGMGCNIGRNWIELWVSYLIWSYFSWMTWRSERVFYDILVIIAVSVT